MRIFFLLLPLLQLFASTSGPSIDTTTFHVKGVVHAPTGQFFLQKVDAVVPGFEPIVLSRSYVSDNNSGLSWEGAWAIFPHTHFILDRKKFNDAFALVAEPNGTVVKYRANQCPDEFCILLPDLKSYHAPPFNREISGRTDVRNNRIEEKFFQKDGILFQQAVLYLGDGGKRIYLSKRFKGPDRIEFELEEEIKPNGNRVLYQYFDDGRIKEIKTQNPQKNKTYASIELAYNGKIENDRDYAITCSDRKKVYYSFLRPDNKHLHDYLYLKHVKGDGNAVIHEELSYDGGYKQKDAKAIKHKRKQRNKLGKHDKKGRGELTKQIAVYRAMDKTRAPFVRELHVAQEPFLELAYYRPHDNSPCFWNQTYTIKATDDLCEKVMEIKEPVGAGNRMTATHSFIYEPNCTKVKDCLGNETHYHFGDHYRPALIAYYGAGKLIRSEKFLWDGLDLKWHIYCDPTGKNSFGRYYEYDTRGNVTQEVLYGNLSGTCLVSFDPENPTKAGVETYVINYSYSSDGFNLPTQKQEDNGLKTLYIYKPGTDLLKSKFICDEDEILIRHFYSYNDDHFLYEEIIDDGNNEDANTFSMVTERKVTRYTPNPHNFPQTMEEYALNISTGEEVLLQKKTFSYSPDKKFQLKKVVVECFKEEESRQYELKSTYEDYQLASQTDPLGTCTTFKHNKRHQLEERHTEGAAIEAFFYKPKGLPAKKTLKDLKTGVALSTTYEYDGLAHKVSEVDPHENTTFFKHDRFGQLSTTTMGSSIYTTEYDFSGNPSKQTDPKEYVTTTIYNARGQPIQMTHPTGKEFFTYYLNGALKEHTDPDGTKIEYEYDVFDRVVRKTTYSEFDKKVAEETKIYNSFHLISETDASEYTTTYEYDLAGRKASETREGRTITFTYDCYGNLETVTQGDLVTITKRDALGQVLEERQELLNGELLEKRKYEYNSQGLPEIETQFTAAGEASYITEYDAFGQVKRREDPLGHETTIKYAFKPHTVTTTDPLKRTITETYNHLGKLEKLERQDPSGKTLALDEYTYDLAGNRETQTCTVYFQGRVLKEIENRWSYGPGNRLKKLSEASNTLFPRKTRYEYTNKGLLKTTIKPDGTILGYTYDALGDLHNLVSSDGTIQYLYEHDPKRREFWITDQTSSSVTYRQLDPFGNLEKEDLANGYTLKRTYDDLDQCTNLTLPDNTIIEKDYEAIHLKRITRLGPNNHPLYSHKFSKYDLSGNLLIEELASNCGQIIHTIDLLGRSKGIQAPGYAQSIDEFDPVGKVISMTTQGTQRFFKYDDLDQLSMEGDETFDYDSNYNRRLHNLEPQEIDDLNQLISSDEAYYTYDLCGNIKTKTTASASLKFSYDALDRLTSVENSDGSFITYAYDPFHRRIAKTVGEKTTQYLYDGQNEIGHETDGHWSLRILDQTPQAEIGASVAIEIDQKLYLPIHDLQGSITALIDPESQSLAEECSYSAFGVTSAELEISPWGYLSKSKDRETGYVFFGRRYYDPNVGRWITTDPKGYTDSMNLYAFALNNPFLLVDPYGLENEFMQKATDVGAFTLNNASQGFFHPINTLSELSSDLQSLGSATYNWDFSAYSAAWQSMNWEERLELTFAKGLKAGGFALAVATIPRVAVCSGAQWVGSKMSAAFGKIVSRSLTKGAAAAEFRLVMSTTNHSVRTSSLTIQSLKKLEAGWVLPKSGGANIGGRWYTEHALERMAPRTPEIMARIEGRVIERARAQGLEFGTKTFKDWWMINKPNPRNIPPSVVEAEILNPGSTNVKVILNKFGEVITVITGG